MKFLNYIPERFAVVILATALFSGCVRQGVDIIQGNYSFKTSGFIQIRASGEYVETDGSGVEHIRAIDTVYTRDLVPQSGQMHVVPLQADSLVLTMNAMGGDVVVMRGRASGSSVYLDGARIRASWIATSLIGQEVVTESHGVLAAGSGRRIKNLLILELDYSGSWDRNGLSYNIISSDVKTVATAND